MSPEQATGDRVIDARSDIYSLGAVLYEMLVGDPPHSAGTTQAIIAKVLTEKAPSVGLMRDTVPEYVDFAVQKSLAKLAADRFATASEFAEALTGARRVMPAANIATGQRDARAIAVGKRSRVSKFAMWGGWAFGLVALNVAAAIWRRPTTTAQTARFLVTLPDSFQLGRGLVLLSPDGSKLVISGRSGGSNGLFLRRLDDPVPQFIRGTEGVGGGVTISPDGNWLLFLRARSLEKVPVTGGAPIAVVDSAGGGRRKLG